MKQGGSCMEWACAQSCLWGKTSSCSCASQRGDSLHIFLFRWSRLEISIAFFQVAEQRPEDASTCLLAARLCYEKLDLLSEGISWAERALAREESVPQDLRARCHLYLGVGRYLQSYEVETREQRVGLCASAGTHLVLAADVDPGDHLAQFYLGLHLATQRRLQEAHSAAQKALLLQPDHLPRWPNLANCHSVTYLSASTWRSWCCQHETNLTKRCDSVGKLSLSILTTLSFLLSGEFALVSLQVYWKICHLTMMTVRARLEEKIVGGEEALATARQMFQVFTSNKNLPRFPEYLVILFLLPMFVLFLPS